MEKTLWKNLKGLLLNYRWAFFRALIMVIIANGLLIIIPIVFRLAITLIDSENGKIDEHLFFIFHYLLRDYTHSVFAWTTVLIILSLLAAYYKYKMRFAFISISREAEKELRSKIYERIQNQSMAFYDRHGTGELLSRLTNDMSAYRDVLGPGLMYPLFFLTIVIPGFFALFSLSVLLATISLIPLFIIPLVNYFIRHSIHNSSSRSQKGLADLSNLTQEHYSGIKIIKGYAIEVNVYEIFKALSKNLIKINMKLNAYQGLLFPFFSALTRMITIILVVIAGIIILEKKETLTPADFISFMWIQSYIFTPILMLAWVMPIYARGKASYERLREIYEEPVEVKDEVNSLLEFPSKPDIQFHDLTFHYPGTERAVLIDFNLSIKNRTFIGITGPIGSGKSTLFKLLNREYEIPRGTIKIGENDIHDYSLEILGKEMVTVEQLPFLFSRTIADNVRFGNEKAEINEVHLVSKYANLHETILDFPEQYETLIGERGVTLSGGQKQRVAIARALLVNRSILLLDDIFSAIDAKTEFQIFKALQTNFKDKTVLLITHRLSILEMMDRVIYLEEGKIVEDGSPDKLINLKGKFAAMVELQRLKE